VEVGPLLPGEGAGQLLFEKGGIILRSDVIWKWFQAAILHDLGKTILNAHNGQWERHEDLSKPLSARDYPDLVGFEADLADVLGDIIERIKAHHGVKPSQLTKESAALIMADGFHKAMHRIEDIEEDKRFSHLQQNPSFYPYYGSPREGWDAASSAILARRAINELRGKRLKLKDLLEVQKHFLCFPHTSYLPHLSLALHHRFTAAIFYLIYKALAELSMPLADLEDFKFTFSLITVTPEPLALFYRLRDVKTHKDAIWRLRRELFRKVFLKHKGDIPDLSPDCNPFEFFPGDSLVLIYDEADEIIGALQEILDQNEALRSLQVEVSTYTLIGERRLKSGKIIFYADPKDVEVSSQTLSLMSSRIAEYPPVSLYRCGICGKPADELRVDERGDSLCPDCFAQRKRARKGVSIEEMAQSAEGEQRIGYIFLAFPSDLRAHAQEVAEQKLLSRFMDQRMVEPRILRPTELGLFEYLQAVTDINVFQDRMEEQLEKIRRRDGSSAYALIRFPKLSGYVLREDQFWRFLGFLNNERDKLKLDTSLKVILCHHKMPFWSLMDRFTTYDGEDLYYDASGGSIVMFNKDEIARIRSVASIAEQERQSSKQLIDLSKIASDHNLDELLLEIDVRERNNRIKPRVSSALKEALLRLAPTGHAGKDQAKRAKFLDYVVKLARPPKRAKRKRR